DGLLARLHDHVHELGEIDRSELGIGEDVPLGDFATTRHDGSLTISVEAGHRPASRRATRPFTYSTGLAPGLLSRGLAALTPSSGAWLRTWRVLACGP